MIKFHVDHQSEINVDEFENKEDFVLYLIHAFAYLKASMLAREKVVLDLGCNIGYGTEVVGSAAKKITGVDVSPSSIEAAKRRYADRDFDFMVIDGETLPFDDNSFDMIVSCQVIEHISDYDQFLYEIIRVLKPDGIVCFTTPNAAIRLDPGMEPWYEFHVKEFTAPDLSETLKRYFSSVAVYGLVAEDPIQSIERNRVTAIKNSMRNPEASLGLKERVKKLLPSFVMDGVRGMKKKMSPESAQNIIFDSIFVDSMLKKRLWYSDDELESALDLLAICSKQDVIKADVHRQLCERQLLGTERSSSIKIRQNE